MSQNEWILLAFKVVSLTSFVSLFAWVAQYHIYTHGAWRNNPIGRTLVVKTSLIALLLVPTILALFFHFSATTSRIAGWVDVVILGAVGPVMWWRMAVWRKLHGGQGMLSYRIAELEAENAGLRERLGETG